MSFQPKATREVQANRTSSETSDNSGIGNFVAIQSRHHPQDLLCRMIRDRQETERCTARDDLSSLRLRLESGSEVCFRYCASASSACVCVWARARI